MTDVIDDPLAIAADAHRRAGERFTLLASTRLPIIQASLKRGLTAPEARKYYRAQLSQARADQDAAFKEVCSLRDLVRMGHG